MRAEEKANSQPVSRNDQMLSRIKYRLAVGDAAREEIYRLRYRAYLNEGTIEPNSKGLTTDPFDDMPNSWIFGVYLDGDLVSSLRISVSSPKHPVSPSVGVFPELMSRELAAQKVIVDPTRFVADPNRAHRFVELPYLTLRLAYVACEHFEADLGLASVRAEHQAFYRRVLMHSIALPRGYPGLTKPIGLMAIDFPKMADKLFARYPFLRSTPAERAMLFDRSVPGPQTCDIHRATIVPHH